MTQANINIDAQMVMPHATIDQARADITSAQAAPVFSQQQNYRAHALVQSEYRRRRRLQSKQAALAHNQSS